LGETRGGNILQRASLSLPAEAEQVGRQGWDIARKFVGEEGEGIKCSMEEISSPSPTPVANRELTNLNCQGTIEKIALGASWNISGRTKSDISGTKKSLRMVESTGTERAQGSAKLREAALKKNRETCQTDINAGIERKPKSRRM